MFFYAFFIASRSLSEGGVYQRLNYSYALFRLYPLLAKYRQPILHGGRTCIPGLLCFTPPGNQKQKDTATVSGK
jgi:hypothetical protein